MSEWIWKRAEWIEENLLPHEARIRAWLARHRAWDIDVDDVVQEMYAKIAALEDVSNIRNPLQYGISVARSIILNHVRRPHIVSITPTGDLDALGVSSTAADPEEATVLREELQAVAVALAEMPERTREVLWLRRVEGLSERETAHRLSISDRTVERHLARAILHLTRRFGRAIVNEPSEELAFVEDVHDTK
jgi:RNA polymerase sigma-70 factor (ECF subfamily)